MKTIAALTQKGLNKTENEDRILMGKTILSDGMLQTEIKDGIVAVADGVGGNKAGAIASQFVVDSLSKLNSISDEALKKINHDLLSLSFSDSKYEGMATTLSGFITQKGKTIVFSVGNSRVYLLQGGKYLKQLTTDDTTLNYLLSAGQLSAEEAEAFDRKNEITACMGGGTGRLFRINYTVLDQLEAPFLMTSDGVHDYLSIDQMEDLIADNGITMTTCQKMFSAARAAGSKDDISIILGEVSF